MEKYKTEQLVAAHIILIPNHSESFRYISGRQFYKQRSLLVQVK